MAAWLALDWDQDQFHLLHVQTTRRGVNVTKAVTWTHPEPFTPSTAERVGRALKEFLRNEKIAAAPVLAGIGRDRILLKELRFPPIAPHEEAALVRFQTSKELTEPIENYAIDYAHLKTVTADSERLIMTVATRREVVQMLQTLCQAAGLKLHAVTPRLFGVGAALDHAVLPDPTPLNPRRRNVVLTLGQRWAELCFFRGQRLVQAQALSKGAMLVSEIKRNLAVFQAQHAVEIDVEGPECLYVFGDDPATVQALQTGLSLPIVTLEPLGEDAVIARQTRDPGAFAGAMGLALLWSESSRPPINLFAPKKHVAPVSATKQRGIIYGVAAATVVLFVVVGLAMFLSSKRGELRQLVQDKTKMEEDLKKAGQDRADVEAYKDWEQTTISWPDELYDLTARFPFESGFRVNQLTAVNDAKKTGKGGYVGRIVLHGITPTGKETYVHQLHASMSRDPHLRSSIDRIKPGAGNNTPALFDMKVDIARQESDKYLTRLILTRGGRPIVPEVEEVMPKQAEDAEGDEP